jgi:alkylhydroperoxidase family enzyme
VRALAAVGRDGEELPSKQRVAQAAERMAGLPGLGPAEVAIATFAARLTLGPAHMQRGAVVALRAAGLTDAEVHDVVHVVGCFAYMNRLADGLGVVLLPSQYDAARTLFGDEALAAHLAWGAAQDQEQSTR